MYIKLFEAYSTEDYQKALSKVRDYIKSDKPKDEIISFINTYYSDSSKEIDKLRIMLDRIKKFYMDKSNRLHLSSEDRMRDKDKSEKQRNNEWYSRKRYFLINKDHEKRFINFLEGEKIKYNSIVKFAKNSNSNINFDRLELIFDRMFEILEWVNATGIEKVIIDSTHQLDYSEKKHRIEMMNDFDMDNEVDELEKIIRVGKKEVNRLINL